MPGNLSNNSDSEQGSEISTLIADIERAMKSFAPPRDAFPQRRALPAARRLMLPFEIDAEGRGRMARDVGLAGDFWDQLIRLHLNAHAAGARPQDAGRWRNQ